MIDNDLCDCEHCSKNSRDRLETCLRAVVYDLQAGWFDLVAYAEAELCVTFHPYGLFTDPCSPHASISPRVEGRRIQMEVVSNADHSLGSGGLSGHGTRRWKSSQASSGHRWRKNPVWRYPGLGLKIKKHPNKVREPRIILHFNDGRDLYP